MPVCKKHPKYNGERPPRVACQTCWEFYFCLSDCCKAGGCEKRFNEVLEGIGVK